MLIKIILEAAEVKKALLFVNKKKRFLAFPSSQLVTHSATILAGIGAGDEDAGIVIDHNGLAAAMRLFDVLDHVPLGGQGGA